MSALVRRFGAILAAAAVGALVFATPAAAHVTVQPGEAIAGSYARFDFRVPNESDEASTIRLEANFPEDAPLPSVRTIDVPGWTAEIETRELDTPVEVHGREIGEAVSKITWTADSEEDGVAPGEFAEFGVSAGPLPDEGVLIFKVIQIYSDGSESAWIDEPTDDGTEPAEPAPILTIVPGGDGHGAPAGDAADSEGDTAAGDDQGDNTALVISLVSAAVALVSLVVAVLAMRKRSAA